jgi:hypothetical protein
MTMDSLSYKLELYDESGDFGKALDGIPEEVAALELDAARYRWLRTQTWHRGSLYVVTTQRVSVKLGTYYPSMEGLDKLIDDAMHIKLEA